MGLSEEQMLKRSADFAIIVEHGGWNARRPKFSGI